MEITRLTDVSLRKKQRRKPKYLKTKSCTR